MKNCPLCDNPMEKVIYFGLPGRFCLACSALTGAAAYAPPVVTETEDGPAFSFMIYHGSYWRALWRWLLGAGSGFDFPPLA